MLFRSEIVTGPTTCSASSGSRGWVRHTGLIPPGRGRTWRVPREVEVHDEPPGEPHHDDISCLLPAGTRLKVADKQGSWMEVLGENLTLPEPEPAPRGRAPCGRAARWDSSRAARRPCGKC